MNVSIDNVSVIDLLSSHVRGSDPGGTASGVSCSRCSPADDAVIAMREPTYFVLTSLLQGPLHGYAIIKRAEELSGGRVRLSAGTLYTGLDRLTAEGYVTLVSEQVVAGRLRRSYGLTDAGSDALRAEAQRMAEAARLVTDTHHAPRTGPLTRKPRPA